MYRTKKIAGGVYYENLDELLECDVTDVTEDDDYYYVSVVTDALYDIPIWKVNKKNKKVEKAIHATDYIVDIAGNATPVDPETLRKRVS